MLSVFLYSKALLILANWKYNGNTNKPQSQTILKDMTLKDMLSTFSKQ